jgi:hypothetical protein
MTAYCVDYELSSNETPQASSCASTPSSLPMVAQCVNFESLGTLPVGWAPYANKDYGWNQGNAYLYYDDADLIDCFEGSTRSYGKGWS